MSMDEPESSRASDKAKEEPIEDDDLYCLDSTFVWIQVERRMFHVATYRFMDESQIFRGMFKLPQPNAGNSDAEGFNRNSPILLTDTSWQDFRNFLKALYPLDVSSQLVLAKEEWISVLRLATFWYFLRFRKLAISELIKAGELTSKDKIVYGRTFKIGDWLKAGCTELVSRSDTISKEEAVAIDYETTFELFRIREKRLRQSITSIPIAVEAILKEELEIMKHFEIEYEEEEPVKEPPPFPELASGFRFEGLGVPATKPVIAEPKREASIGLFGGQFGGWGVRAEKTAIAEPNPELIHSESLSGSGLAPEDLGETQEPEPEERNSKKKKKKK